MAGRQNGGMWDNNWIAEFTSVNDGASIEPIHGAHLPDLAPASHWVREWTDYKIVIPDADRLLVGSVWYYPFHSGVFQLKRGYH